MSTAKTILGTYRRLLTLHSATGKLRTGVKKLFFTLALTILVAGQAQAKEILWALENFEPFYFLEGPSKGEGLADQLTQFLIERMPEYSHHFEYMPILRITDSLKTSQPIAVQAYLRNPADKEFVIYTHATMVVPHLKLTLRRTDWKHHWDSAPSISLNEFLDRGFLLGTAGRRYYNDILNPILNAPGHKHPPLQMQSSHYRNQVDMITRGRIDATIGYTIELNYYKMRHAALAWHPNEALVSIPFSEDPGYNAAYIALPKSEWGYKVRERINNILIEERLSHEYLSILYNWFGNSEEYKKAITSEFNTPEASRHTKVSSTP